MINDMNCLWLRNIYYRYFKANHYPLHKKSKFDNQINNLKNIYLGKSCFIIGNGPSLKVEDLDKIEDSKIISFASNSIYKLFDQTKWRPNYYVFQDQQIIDGLNNIFAELMDCCDGMVIRRDAYYRLPKSILDNPKLFLPKLVLNIRKDRYYDFSGDISACAFDGCTVTYLMLQLAYFMGFKKMYLIGVDHNFPVVFDMNDNIVSTDTKNLHCFEDNKNIVLNPSRALEAAYAYKSAKGFCEERDVKILNATRGGKLDIFERISLDLLWGRMKHGE